MLRKLAVTVQEKQNIPGTFFCSQIHLICPAFFWMKYTEPGINHWQCPVFASAIYKENFTFVQKRNQLFLQWFYRGFFIINRNNNRNLLFFQKITSSLTFLQFQSFTHPVSKFTNIFFLIYIMKRSCKTNCITSLKSCFCCIFQNTCMAVSLFFKHLSHWLLHTYKIISTVLRWSQNNVMHI